MESTRRVTTAERAKWLENREKREQANKREKKREDGTAFANILPDPRPVKRANAPAQLRLYTCIM